MGMDALRVGRAALFLLAVIATAPGCRKQPERPPMDPRVDHLRAFTKLYGYIRYFHPSDEAAALDWDRFALLGVERVRRVRDAAELRRTLEELFLPVAPTLRLYTSDEPPPKIRLPAATPETQPVAWQHLGYGFGTMKSAYHSARTNRTREERGPPVTRSGSLFDGGPGLGEMVTRPLGAGLSCRFPLVLPSVGGRTWGEPQRPLAPLEQTLAQVDASRLDGEDLRVRLAGVAIAWNVFQHFYPYFDVVRTDWDAVLTRALGQALVDRTHADHTRNLRWLVAQLQDGHGRVQDKRSSQRGRLRWDLEWIAGQVVVTAAAPETELRPGDLVETFAGQPMGQKLAEAEALVSGSPQWQRVQALEWLSVGTFGQSIEVTVRRGEARHTRRLMFEMGRYTPPERRPNLQRLDSGAWYVDLDRTPWGEIAPRLEELAAAPGVIFDLRGYPRSNHQVIQHLLRENDRSDAWMRVPQIAWPDREKLVGYQNHGWQVTRAEPHIQGKVVFITGPRAISYAESFMSFIEHYRLAEIVGQPTAGTNGNVNPFDVPGGFSLVFTGMKVVKHDGSQLHHIGIQPTVPVERTLEGVRAGRDEPFEAALRLVGGGA
jgi:hypothetical protein